MAKNPSAVGRESAAVQAVEAMREAGAVRPYLLAAWALVMADETGVWEPPSKAALRRALTRPGDEWTCTPKELTTALVLARGWGLIDQASTERRLILAGGDR